MPDPSPVDRTKLAALLEQFKLIDAQGSAGGGYAQRAKRSEILDDLQDAVGLGGRMVMEKDILTRAQTLLAASA